MALPSSLTEAVAHLAVSLADELPTADLRRVAAAFEAGAPAVGALRQRLASVRLRQAVTSLVALGAANAAVAGALAAAADAAERADHRALDVVWTGPASRVGTARLTSAVVQELLATAKEEILLVGYAVQASAGITGTLMTAAAAGVRITLLLENDGDNPRFEQHEDALRAVPARRLRWPAEHREANASLHAKVLVVDRRAMLVGSANLTGSALERNLECGLFVTGGNEPEQVVRHVESLLEEGHLVPA